MEVCTKFPTARKNIHILAYFTRLWTFWDSLTLHPKAQKRMKNVIKREQCKLACGLPNVNILSKVSKFKVLLYLKKSNLDKEGKAPIMGRITLNRSNLFACQSKNSMAQFSWKLSCNPKLDPATNRYSVNFSSEEDVRFLKMFDRSVLAWQASPHSSRRESLESLFMWWHSTRVSMNIMQSWVNFTLDSVWLETTTTRHWKNWRATFQNAEPQHWCTGWRNAWCS